MALKRIFLSPVKLFFREGSLLREAKIGRSYKYVNLIV